MRPTLLIICVLFSINAFSATITSVGSGDWLTPGTWDLGRIPADDDLIIIDTGHTVEISGDAIVLDNVQLVIRGTLFMDDSFTFPFVASLTLTGAGSGIFIEEGGSIDEDITNLGELGSVITVNGIPVWNACDDPTCVAVANAILNGLGLPDLEQAGDITAGMGGLGLPATFGDPLPVEMLFFSATNQNGSTLLEWATATEETNSHFEIQRSVDAENFEVLTSIPGAGDSKVRIDYEWVDRESDHLNREYLYYRLRQVDFDGKFEFSKTIVARNEDFKPYEILVWPNPFDESITVTLELPDDEEAVMSIIDMNGQEIYHQEKFLYSGRNDLSVEYLGQLASGVYLINITGPTLYINERIVKAN